jgi:hypothetical protein
MREYYPITTAKSCRISRKTRLQAPDENVLDEIENRGLDAGAQSIERALKEMVCILLEKNPRKAQP